jgi:hypothetical protein
MMEEIKLFLFVLSIIYSLRIAVEFVVKLTQDNPEPMKISKVEQTLLLLSISFVITHILI